MDWNFSWSLQPAETSSIGITTRGYVQKITAMCSLEGESIRLEMANECGSAPLCFDSILIGLSGGGKSAPLTLGGNEKICIPAGERLFSDPAPLAVKPGDIIEIEAFAKDGAVMADADILYQNLPAGVNASGELLAAAGHEKELEGILSLAGAKPLFGIYGLQVLCNAPAKQVAFFGDSITQMGFWTGPLTKALFEIMPGKIGTINRGISGNRILRDSAVHPTLRPNIAGKAGIKRFENDVFGTSAPDVVFVLEGINDICHPLALGIKEETVSAPELIEGLEYFTKIIHAHDAKAVGCTILPFKGYKNWNPQVEGVRKKVNDWIRGTASYDLVLDFDDYISDLAEPDQIDGRWHRGDYLHPNAEGGAQIAGCIPLEKITGFL